MGEVAVKAQEGKNITDWFLSKMQGIGMAIITALTLVGIGHILRLLFYKLGKKEELKIEINLELAFILFWIFIIALYTFFD